MKQQWQSYSDKFLQITPREQGLIIFTGLAAIIFVIYSFFIEANSLKISKLEKQVATTQQGNRSNKNTILIFEQGLAKDPNDEVNRQIKEYQQGLAKIDANLLELTSELIGPIQMRQALIQLLKIEKGVSLLSFQVLPIREMIENPVKVNKDSDSESKSQTTSTAKVTLYRHGIKVRLKGRYFQLRNYLKQLERLPWKFFWQKFSYQLVEYPDSQLELEMYSLSTKQEFIGV